MRKYRNLDGGGNLFAALSHQKATTQGIVGILKLRDFIHWEDFRPVLESVTGYDTKDWRKGGRRSFDLLLMFKILVLQKYHGLSDEATEAQIRDCLSFMSFLGLRLGDEIPDANTIWDFKELIEKDQRDGRQKLFNTFHQILTDEGLIAKEGKCPEEFDPATAKSRQKDCEARWTKKNNEVHYRYKNHAKVDAKSKLIDKHKTTAVHIHDSQVFKDLRLDLTAPQY